MTTSGTPKKTVENEPSQASNKEMGAVIQFDENMLKDHFGEFVRSTVEETLNNYLDAEADHLCGAKRYEHSKDRKDTRAGHYERGLDTRAGRVKLKVPKLRKLPFETQIIERYKRRETSVEEALVEMYLAGVSVRRVEDVTEALWGTRVSASTVSQLNQKIYGHIETWRNRQLSKRYPYVFLDGIWLKRSWGGEVKNVSVLVAIGVNEEGHREMIGVSEGLKEDQASWTEFLRHLRSRGMEDVELFVSDKCLGLLESVTEIFPNAKWQRCTVHFHKNIQSVVPRGKMRDVADMLKAIYAQESREEAQKKAESVACKLEEMKLKEAAKRLRDGIDETLSYYAFPPQHYRHLKTNNPLERIMREIRRRTRVVGNFPDGKSALMLVSARLRHIATTQWGERRYMDMDHLKEHKQQEGAL
jgi:putative transposase